MPISLSRYCSVFLLHCAFVTAGFAQSRPDGTLLASGPCEADPVGTYAKYVEASRAKLAQEIKFAKQEGFVREMPADLEARLLTREEFRRATAYAGFECRRIEYMSDGLKVAGFLWKPKSAAGRKLPLIIYNRGGNREFGKLRAWEEFGHYHYVASGFVVVGSQYRGNDGGEGREELGGSDVRDVLNLIPLARSLGYVDMDNVFMLGWSRGGMMTYLALKHGAPVNAAAVGGGLTDLVAWSKNRPELTTYVYRPLIPDFDARGEEALRERSAMYWPERINVPVLILHGETDWRVDPATQLLPFVQKLQELGKVYELAVYARDDHGLTLNRAEGDRKIVEWFRAHMKRTPH